MSDNIQVLIVEDDITSSEVLELLLKHEDVLATTVTRSDHTMVVLHQIPAIRIVFVDLELPDAWGYEVLRAIRADPAFADLTVVAYTAHLSELVQAKHAGFDGFLGKPLSSAAFPEQFANIVAGKQVWTVRA